MLLLTTNSTSGRTYTCIFRNTLEQIPDTNSIWRQTLNQVQNISLVVVYVFSPRLQSSNQPLAADKSLRENTGVYGMQLSFTGVCLCVSAGVCVFVCVCICVCLHVCMLRRPLIKTPTHTSMLKETKHSL